MYSAVYLLFDPVSMRNVRSVNGLAGGRFIASNLLFRSRMHTFLAILLGFDSLFSAMRYLVTVFAGSSSFFSDATHE